MSRLALYLLGPPRIERDGIPLKLGRRKAIALLAYLAVTGQSHRRDSLVNLLWPDYDTARGRAALRRTLYALRSALGSSWLDADREEIGLHPGAGQALWVDVDQFHHHLAQCESHGHPTSQTCPACVAPLTEAVALVQGEFLSGFSLKDSFNFDDWQLFQAELLRRELDGALDRLVHWHSARREFELAEAYTRRRLALDPLDEPAHRQLMRLYTWSGRRPAALRQYEECMAHLKDQLGVPPHEATVELYQAIQEGRAPPPPEEKREQEAPLPRDLLFTLEAEPPPFLEEERPVERPLFVAREGELAQLDGYLAAVLAGRGKVVFVTGDAGCGKTALIQEFTHRAHEAHANLIVASGDCNAYTGTGDPYLPFREILELLTGDIEAPWTAGAITGEHARRLWQTLPLAARALVKAGPDLIDTFIPASALMHRAFAHTPGGTDWLAHLDEFMEGRAFRRSQDVTTHSGVPSPQQSDLFKQYTTVLQTLARQVSLVLVVDDLQWADVGSISLLFHVGRHLAGSRILVVGAYRPEEIALGRDGARHPLVPVVNELQRQFGDIAVNVDRAQHRAFLDALLDSEPNRLGSAFREMLYRQTRGHPLFTLELLQGMQDRGDLVQDQEGKYVEGPALDWETLPARVEAVVAERIGRLAQPLRAALRVASVEGELFTAEVVAQVRATDERETLGHLSDELDRRHRLVRAQSILRMDGQTLSRYRFRHILYQKYLYQSLDPVQRVHLHEQVGTTLERLYGAREDGTTVAEIAPQLARHFQEAGITEKAIQYLHQAGERAVQLSAYEEGITHLTKGLALLMSMPDPGGDEQRLEHAEQELALQVSLGMAWMGISAIEVEKAFLRARELCQQTGKTTQLCWILGQQATIHYVRAEYQWARELGEEALNLAQQAEDVLLEALGHWRLGFIKFALGEYTAARAHLGQMITFYEPRQHHRLVFHAGSNAGLSARAYDACCLWCLGYPEQALEKGHEVLAMAQELGHPFSLADVLCFAGCLFSSMRRDVQALKDHSEALVRLASEKGMPTWLGMGTWNRGKAVAMLGHVQEGMAQLREGMVICHSEDTGLYIPVALHALAELQAETGYPEEGLITLAEALARVEQTDERHWEAELHRLRAELLLMQGEYAKAETSLQKAIDIARRQSAKSWELRATTSLARLWQTQGRLDEARQVLAEVYTWFTEGFDTPDLQEARELLEELA